MAVGSRPWQPASAGRTNAPKRLEMRIRPFRSQTAADRLRSPLAAVRIPRSARYAIPATSLSWHSQRPPRDLGGRCSIWTRLQPVATK